MAKALVAALALASLPSALAFRNTSPFFLFSTAELSIHDHDVELAPAATITSQLIDTLKECPSKTYFVVRQEGVLSADYRDRRSAPRLATYFGRPVVKSSMGASEVIGNVDVELIADHLVKACRTEVLQHHASKGQFLVKTSRPDDAPPQLIEIILPAPPASRDRERVLDKYDAFLDSAIRDFGQSGDYTVLYTTTAPTEAQLKTADELTYEMEEPFEGTVQMELKRDTAFHRRAENVKEGGLFEKYQYFSPGLFMGLSAMVPLVLILIVGLKSIASLEVSYFAFSKEMGPSGQRK